MRTSALILLAILLFGCNRDSGNSRLARIASLIDRDPHVALDSLRAIDSSTLSENDRHYYDFLSIKAADKAFIDHRSDSLILDVLNHYGPNDKLYPEVLYYAGRVYSDLGDSPTALEYFQKSIEQTESDPERYLHLRGCLFSQTGGLLTRLRMFTQAIPYLEKTLAIDSIEKDTFNLAYDNQLLGSVYYHLSQYDKAERHFRTAYDLAAYLKDSDLAFMQVYLAAIKHKQGKIDSAIMLIRDVPERVISIDRNAALIYASDIYKAAGITDTAYMYAERIIRSNNSNNRKNGYRNLLSSELSPLIPLDSLRPYVNRYYAELDSFYNSHDSEQAIIQNSLYNYQLQQKDRIRAEESRNRTIVIAAALAILVLVLVIFILTLRIRHKSLQVKLHQTLQVLEQLHAANSSPCPQSSPVPVHHDTTIDSLREQIRLQAEAIANVGASGSTISQHILNSEHYQELMRHLREHSPIREDSELWERLNDVILESSPNFRKNINLLVGHDLKPQDHHTLMLIKCGMNPTQLATLTGRAKGTISYRRRQLRSILFSDQIDPKYLDYIIQSL